MGKARVRLLCAAGLLAAGGALWCLWPRLAALGLDGVQRLDAALAARAVPHYTARLDALRLENYALHTALAAGAGDAAENAAMRAFLGCEPRPEGSWQPARVAARAAQTITLACDAEVGAAVLDRRGRLAGRVTQADGGACTAAAAGSAGCPAAGLAGEVCGVLEVTEDGWRLCGLPVGADVPVGTAVTDTAGRWLGRTADAPTPDAAALTAAVPLSDTADLYDTVYFVEVVS